MNQVAVSTKNVVRCRIVGVENKPIMSAIKCLIS